MAAPVISPLPPAPLLTDSKTAFNAKASPFVAALDVFRQELNEFGVYLGDEVDIVKTIRAPEDLLALPNTEGRASRILGFSAGGDPVAHTYSSVRTLLNVEDGATANETDDFLLNRSNHEGTQLANTISDFVESVQENATTDVQGMELADVAYIEVDDLLRPVRFVKTDGRYYQAVDGRLSNLFGGPDSGRAVPLIQDWAELTVDAEGRPVSGMKVDGTRYTAVNGRLVSEDASAKSSMPSIFVAYGDSTTYGDDLDDEKGAGWEAYRWTTLISQSLGVQVDNRGVNGQRAEQIAVRSGGVCATAKPTGGKIPASGSVVLTDFNPGNFAGANGFSTLVDLMADDGSAVRGSIVSTSTGNVMTFTRLRAGVEVDVNVVDIIPVQGRKDLQNHFILGAGINNESRIVSGEQTIEQIKSWYSSMTARANNGFTVWGVLDRGLSEAEGTAIGDYIRTLEEWLRITYGDNFCDVRGYLSSQRALDDAVMLDTSYTPTTNDNNAVAGNTVPPSFRSSGGSVHLNSRGHALQARFMARYFRRRYSNYIHS